MKFSERWLRTMVDPPLDTAALCDKLTMAGLEVENVSMAAPPFTRVVVAKILSVAPHANADRLRVCQVDAGQTSTLQIVCGAPNAAAGMIVACALEGAALPGGLAIKRTSVRGVESQGMLCSAKELGLSDDASGLIALSPEHKAGTDLRAAIELDDALITLKLTPNRADCLSVAGIARDVAAITGVPATLPECTPVRSTIDARRNVRIEDFDACPRFAARIIDGIDATAATPEWMKARLERSGIRSISAVVDITNYVMLELGQPLHAYDDHHLEGDIVVRFARPGETLTLLNGQILTLDRDLLLVCDEEKTLGLAGIMGGEHSGIANDTKTVFLEGAFWNPAVIQGKMRRLGFVSDAGYRFERGVDFELGPRGVERATQLILAICGGKAGPLVDTRGPLPSRAPVRVRTSRVARLLGLAIAPETIDQVFRRLKFAPARDGDSFTVTPPSYRFDLALEEDFIEEVARIHGFDAIPAQPSAHVQHMLPRAEDRREPIALKRALVLRDWQEVVTFSFVSSEIERALDPNAQPIAVVNPIAAPMDVMRTTLLPGLIGTLRTNLNRKAPRVRVFEVGRVFAGDGADEQPLEIGGIAFGDALPVQWGTKGRSVDFYDVKGDLEALAYPGAITTTRATRPWLHPARSAEVRIDGKPAGWIGELHPRLLQQFEIPGPAVAFEVGIEALAALRLPAGQSVSNLPIVRRDIAFYVDDAVPAQAILDALEASKPPQVRTIHLFDMFRGLGLPPGKKSLAILVLIQDTARTLTDAEIEGTVATLFRVLHERFGATLRNQGSKP
jgi:phenylalanyl-tRNA synthetase beta chain